MSSVYHLGILEEVMLSTHLGFFRISVCKMKVFPMKTGLTRAPVDMRNTCAHWVCGVCRIQDTRAAYGPCETHASAWEGFLLRFVYSFFYIWTKILFCCLLKEKIYFLNFIWQLVLSLGWSRILLLMTIGFISL